MRGRAAIDHVMVVARRRNPSLGTDAARVPVMTAIRFKAPEYQSDGSFVETAYQFRGSESTGWCVLHDGAPLVRLGPGYTPVPSIYCGVCSTDLARHRLPFPLPQIIGHEAVGLVDGTPVVVDINASHRARGDHTARCPFCAAGLDTHCPERLTLGIDRLPGALAPCLLAPVAGLHRVPAGIPTALAALAEPFAAALRAVELSSIQAGDQVAVLGPRRLGMLVLSALAAHRSSLDLDFEIIGVVRHGHLIGPCMELGADRVIDTTETPPAALHGAFDIVYDTTGRPAGLETAVQMARRSVHVKSTHGQSSLGLEHLTELVIDEIALERYEGPDSLTLTPPNENTPRRNANIYVAPSVPDALVAEASAAHPARRFHRMTPAEALKALADDCRLVASSPLPHFDLALVAHLAEADAVIRPREGHRALLRPVGTILLAGEPSGNPTPLEVAVRRGVKIHTSRCGDLSRALVMMQDNSPLVTAMRRHLVTHLYPLAAVENAFATAADSAAIKVLVKTGSAFQG